VSISHNRKMFNKIDYKSITSISSNENWTEVYNAYNDVNHCYNVFDQIIKNSIDKSTTRIILR